MTSKSQEESMKKLKKSLAVAMFALFGAVAVSAHAETVNLPASAALMNGEYVNSNCIVADPVNGITAGDFAGICDMQFPVQLPAGRTLQQIEVVYGAINNGPAPFLDVHLGTVDFTTGMSDSRFPWLANLMPGGTFHTKRLMQQTKVGAYPDAFVVQQNTMYQVFVHLENGAYITGLRITYQ
jgi:hypothetical protein